MKQNKQSWIKERETNLVAVGIICFVVIAFVIIMYKYSNSTSYICSKNPDKKGNPDWVEESYCSELIGSVNTNTGKITSICPEKFKQTTCREKTQRDDCSYELIVCFS